ncbi:MAG: hypothetical protein MHM6MM_002630 [Cercozoa sp. M6MM]
MKADTQVIAATLFFETNGARTFEVEKLDLSDMGLEKALIPHAIVLVSFETIDFNSHTGAPNDSTNEYAVFGYIESRTGTSLKIKWQNKKKHPFCEGVRKARERQEQPRVWIRFLHSLTDTKRYFESVHDLSDKSFLLSNGVDNINHHAEDNADAADWLSEREQLNVSQRNALQSACNERQRVTLVQTPPGTESNKLHLIHTIIKFFSERNRKVLVCTPTQEGAKCLLTAIRKHDGLMALTAVLYLQSRKRDFGNIVFATPAGAGTLRTQWRPDVVVIDDAVRLHEYQALIPVSLGRDKFVLLGDPSRLQATVPASLMNRFFQESLFERLMKTGYPTIPLLQQDRMDPRIAGLRRKQTAPSGAAGALTADSEKVKRDEHKWENKFHWISNSLRFGTARVYNVRDGKERVCNRTSYRNYEEAGAVKSYFEFILRLARDAGVLASGNVPSVGFLSPYGGQVRLMEQEVMNSLQAYPSNQREGIRTKLTFDTIDSDVAQRSSFDIVLLSTVRTSDCSFIEDPRRLNVALTRANHMLAVFGHEKTLRQGAGWSSLIPTLD